MISAKVTIAGTYTDVCEVTHSITPAILWHWHN